MNSEIEAFVQRSAIAFSIIIIFFMFTIIIDMLIMFIIIIITRPWPAGPSVIVVRIQLHTPRLAPAALGSGFEYGKKMSGNSRTNKIFENGKKVSGNRKTTKSFGAKTVPYRGAQNDLQYGRGGH